jgi:predicted RNA-binding Zn-ribbon protein involved in translation (DUF1610 family)
MTNEYFVETLHHFTCVSCNGWWSIAMDETDRTNWYCPWCGEETDYIRAINEALLHDTDLAHYSQVDWIEREVGYGSMSTDYSVHSKWAETSDKIKARSLIIEEYVNKMNPS